MNPMMLVGPAMSAAGSMKAGKAADAAGKYKQQVAERNAKVVEQEKLIKHHQTGEDIIRFREKFRAVQGGTAMSLAKAGVRSDTGTGLRIMMENARLADEDIAAAFYNAELGQRTLDEKATQMRLQGEMYAFEGRSQKSAYQMKAATSLLSGLSKASPYTG